ncbi:MAG: hypothetical protein V4685_17295 [Bacteroidota bacterium]
MDKHGIIVRFAVFSPAYLTTETSNPSVTKYPGAHPKTKEKTTAFTQ